MTLHRQAKNGKHLNVRNTAENLKVRGRVEFPKISTGIQELSNQATSTTLLVCLVVLHEYAE